MWPRIVADPSTLGRHVCYVCKRSVCGGDEPQPVAHLGHKLQCARQSLKIMLSYGNKYPRHNARPHVNEQSGQCARDLSAFPYQTMLGKMKRRIRSSNKPLEQSCKRLSEGAFAFKVDEHVNRYRIIPGKMKDSCVMPRNRDIMLVEREENSVLIWWRFIYKECFKIPLRLFSPRCVPGW